MHNRTHVMDSDHHFIDTTVIRWMFGLVSGIPVSYKDVASIDPEYAKNLQVTGVFVVMAFSGLSAKQSFAYHIIFVYTIMEMYVI